jgi:cytochrome c553
MQQSMTWSFARSTVAGGGSGTPARLGLREAPHARRQRWIAPLAAGLAASLASGCVAGDPEATLERDASAIFVEEWLDRLPNSIPFPNPDGWAATYSARGELALDGAFFTPQGTNGRTCGTCHAPENGWSLNGDTVATLFALTDGTHPLFANNLDTDRPTADMSTPAARWAATTMLRQGLFTRKVAVPATRDYDVIGVDDPMGVSTPAVLFWFRRTMPTANLRSPTVHWDSVNTVGTDLRQGLMKQVRGSVVNAQQGLSPSTAIQEEIADYQLELSHAQVFLWGVGRLDAAGAKGGPVAAAAQPLVAGRFDLFDAWRDSPSPRRRQIWRGQEVFNSPSAASGGRRCGGCHNAANNGQHVGGALFDIGASRPELSRPGVAVFTFQQRETGAIVRSTDPGAGLRDGRFASLNKFKTPSLRGLAARAPYFHGGSAPDLAAVVHHYEVALGFDFTPAEEADLIAFMKAL